MPVVITSLVYSATVNYKLCVFVCVCVCVCVCMCVCAVPKITIF